MLIHHDIGVLEVDPSDSNTSIVISSGIHGDETAPLEFIDDIVNDILDNNFCPTVRILFIIAHPKAINANTRFIDENLNRHFAAKKTERNVESKIANKLQRQVLAFFSKTTALDERWHFDLHSAIRDSVYPIFAIIPVSTRKTDIRPLISFIQSGNVQAILLSEKPSSTFSWWTSETFSAFSATIEMGRVNPLYQNNMKDYLPLKAAFQTLLMGSLFSCEQAKDAFSIFRVSRSIIKRNVNFQLTFPSQTANFSFFPEGELLAQEKEIIYRADKDGEAVVFPNADVAIGQRACLLVQPISPDLSLPLYVNLNSELLSFD